MGISPSIVPRHRPGCFSGTRRALGRMGCAWRETNVEDTDLEAVIQDLLEGQYSNPVRVTSRKGGFATFPKR